MLFPGYISGPLLEELYAHCSFYVLPSLVEGLSISLLEAMGAGCPVLVSDIPENLEVSGDIAVTFERDNEEDLARAIRSMLGMDDSRRGELGGRGREKITREYSWDGIADGIGRLYRRRAGGRPDRP